MALALSAAACTSYKLTEPTAPIQPWSPGPGGLATVCVVRTSVLALAVSFPVRDNGALVGATRGPTHFCYYAEPGEHEITIEADSDETARLIAEPEGRYFLKLEVDNIAGWVRARSVWITEDLAREDFDSSVYQVLAGVPGTEKLPGEAPVAPAKPVPAVAGTHPPKG
ncbi:MAG: hypothetical protein R3B70_39140 [Polyangiaceae bacterium]